MTRIPESTLTDNFRDGDPWDAQTLNKIVAVLIAGINANYEDILEAVMTPGPAGPVGPQGPEGPKGPQGVEGPIGPQGIEGPQGDKGDKGDKGDTVVSLTVGTTTTVTPSTPASVENVGTPTEAVLNFKIPQGPVGLTGAQGPKGDTGAEGPQGPQGVEGPIGPQGLKGDIGLTGVQGPKGDKGNTGAGVVTGGTTGQALVKKSGTNYDTEWKTLQNAISIPEYSVPYRNATGTGNINSGITVAQNGATVNSIARRTSTGALFVATPTNNSHAANKSYADKKRPRCYTALKNRATINITQVWTKFDAGPLYYWNGNDTSIASISGGDLIIASGISKVLMSAHCELLDTGPAGDMVFQIRNVKDGGTVRELYQSGGSGWKGATISPFVVNVVSGDKFDISITCGGTGNRDIGTCYLTVEVLE